MKEKNLSQKKNKVKIDFFYKKPGEFILFKQKKVTLMDNL